MGLYIAAQEFPQFGVLLRSLEGTLVWVFMSLGFAVGVAGSWRASLKACVQIFAVGLGIVLAIASVDWLFGITWLDTWTLATNEAPRIALGYGVMLGSVTSTLLNPIIANERPLSGKL
jgi:hypothetical protein